MTNNTDIANTTGIDSGLVEQAAEQLGITLKYAWRVLVEAQPVTGVIHLLEIAIVVSLTFYAARRAFRYGNSLDKNDETDALVGSFTVGLLAFLISSILAIAIGNALQEILLPEYSALMEIINTLKEVRG